MSEYFHTLSFSGESAPILKRALILPLIFFQAVDAHSISFDAGSLLI